LFSRTKQVAGVLDGNDGEMPYCDKTEARDSMGKLYLISAVSLSRTPETTFQRLFHRPQY
jgi:hypothetical protein